MDDKLHNYANSVWAHRPGRLDGLQVDYRLQQSHLSDLESSQENNKGL